MNLRSLNHPKGQAAARSLAYIGIVIAVTAALLVLYKVLMIHFQVEDFTDRVKALQSRLDEVQAHLHTSERSTSLVELERVLAVLNEISSEVSPGPVKDEADALKTEVVSLMEELRKETAPAGVSPSETVPKPEAGVSPPAEPVERTEENSETPVPPHSESAPETLGITGEGPIEKAAEPSLSLEPTQAETTVNRGNLPQPTVPPETKVEENGAGAGNPERSPVPGVRGLAEGVEEPTPLTGEP